MSIYYQYPLLNHYECVDYINYFESKTDKIKIHWYEENRRDHTLLIINPLSELYEKFCSRIRDQHELISHSLGLKPVEKIKFYDVFISKYNPHQYVKWHFDRQIFRLTEHSNEPTNPRLYNISVNLNSEYEGGDLAIRTRSPKTIYDVPKAEPGFATSFETKHSHTVYPITNGNRYSLIGWVYDDNDPEYYQGVHKKWLQ